VKKREKADGEDREEETQGQGGQGGEGGAASEGEADTQQARWQRAPKDDSPAHTPSQDCDAAQGGLSKKAVAYFCSAGSRVRDPAEDVFARPALEQVNPRMRRGYLSKFLAIGSADIRQWIPSPIPAKHKKMWT